MNIDAQVSRMTRHHTIASVVIALATIAIAQRVVTLLTEMIVAKEFGASLLSDAYMITQDVPELFTDLLIVGFSTVFIPMFAEYRVTLGEDEAWRFASAFICSTALLSASLTAMVMIGSPLLVRVIAPGFVGTARQVTTQLLQIMSLSIFFLGLTSGLTGLLHSQKVFVMPQIGRTAYSLVLLGAAFSLISKAGVSALAWGVVLGTLTQLIIHFGVALKHGATRLTWVIHHPGIRQAAGRLVPILIAISGVKIGFFLNRMVASGLPEGSVAALAYANRLILLPVGLLVIPLQTVIFPTLSDLSAENQLQELAETVLSALRALLFIVIPACIGLTVLSVPVTQILFQRGAFDSLATQTTSEALGYYALGVPAIASIFILSRAYFALGESTSLVKLFTVSWSVNLLLSLILSRYFAHKGIALSMAIASTITAVLMLFSLKEKGHRLLKVRPLLSSVGRTVLASLMMGLLLLVLSSQLNDVLVQLKLDYQLVQVNVLILIGGSIYLLGAALLKVDELAMLMTVLGKLVGARRSFP